MNANRKGDNMKDFFVSYTGTDVDFATWVAELLESEKYTVVIQAWDFKPGDNFVSKINESLKECRKLIVILSEDYLASKLVRSRMDFEIGGAGSIK